MGVIMERNLSSKVLDKIMELDILLKKETGKDGLLKIGLSYEVYDAYMQDFLLHNPQMNMSFATINNSKFMGIEILPVERSNF